MGNWLDRNYRLAQIDSIENTENKGRRAESFTESELQNGRLQQYVVEYLRGQFSKKTVDEMPIISCLNLYKKVTNNLASVYKKAPERDYLGASDKQVAALNALFEDGDFDQKLLKGNRNIVGQRQGLGMIVPKNGKLVMRVLRPHHYDVVPKADDPETAEAYIISTLDRNHLVDDIKKSATGFTGASKTYDSTDNIDNSIADQDDYKNSVGKYLIWTDKYNFMMNAKGQVVIDGVPRESFEEEEIMSPFFLAGLETMPFFELHLGEKDFEYWVRDGSALANFVVQFNGAFSDVGQIVRMQGWSQAVLTAEKDMMPESITVGPSKVLKLPVTPGTGFEPKFSFATPNSDIEGSLKYLETFLYLFLSTEEVDPKVVSTKGDSTTYSSGFERLLAMVEKMEATDDHYSLFKKVEGKIFEIVSNWQLVLEDDPTFDEKYKTGSLENVSFTVKFKKPESARTTKDKLEELSLKKELGLASRLDMLMEIDGLSLEAAQKKLLEIDQEEMFVTASNVIPGLTLGEVL